MLIAPYQFANKGRRAISLWSIEERAPISLLGSVDDQVTAVEVSPDNKLVVTGSADGELRVWNGQSGAFIRSLGNIGGEPVSLAFSSNSRFLIVLCKDGKTGVFDFYEVKPTEQIVISAGSPRLSDLDVGVKAVAISDDGNRLLTVSDHGRVVLEPRHDAVHNRRLAQVAALPRQGRSIAVQIKPPMFSKDGSVIIIPSRYININNVVQPDGY